MKLWCLIKAASLKLHYLRLLKRAKVPAKDLLGVYYSVVRSALEYACPVWSSSLTTEQSSNLELIQKRALKIIFPTLSYEQCLIDHNILTLADRRLLLSKKFFMSVIRTNNPVSSLMCKNQSRRQRGRNTLTFQLPMCKTDRYKNSFVPFALQHFQ